MWGRTLLSWAVNRRDEAVAKLLMDRSNISMIVNWKMLMAGRGDEVVIRLLMSKEIK